MNTVGVQNPDCNEKRKWYAAGFLVVLRYAIPPHRDNETTAEQLYRIIGRNNNNIEGRSVRLDSLINAPTNPMERTSRSSRASVAQFMTKPIDDADVWRE